MLEASIVIIVNNLDIYKDFMDNLTTQKGVDYEVLAIDNSDNQYDSARHAFNEASKNAKGKFIIFMHPDIRFLSKSSLADVISCGNRMEEFGVIGVAGCPQKLENGKRVLLSNIIHGPDKTAAGRNIDRIVAVQTVDECMFIIRNTKQVIFSERDGWHLYAVELCLNKLLEGKKNYVAPAQLWHMSDGKSLDYKYVIQMKDLIKVYGKYFITINTTVKKWNTRGIKSAIYLNYYILKQYMKRLILR